MSTIIRVKRSLLEDPLEDKIVLNFKRQRTEKQEFSAIFKFAGTSTEAANIQEHIDKITKEEAKDIINKKSKGAVEDLLGKRLEQNQEKRQQNRIKIVNLSRAISSENGGLDNANAENVSILDVEKDQIKAIDNLLAPPTTANASSSSANSYSDISEEAFVYDIYVSDKDNIQADHFDLNDLSILEYNDYLYSCPRLMDDKDDEMSDEDEDSNDEANWRNDYPDEDQFSDEDGSIGERQMRRAVANFDIDNELSSDDENDFVYSVDSESATFEDDIDFSSGNRYGRAYAKYRKKNLKLLQSNDEVEEDEDDLFHSD